MTAIDCAEATGEARGIAKGITKGIAKGKAEGLSEGKAEGKALSVLKVLSRKFGRLPENLPKRILRIQNEMVLDRLFDSAMDSQTLQDFEESL